MKLAPFVKALGPMIKKYHNLRHLMLTMRGLSPKSQEVGNGVWMKRGMGGKGKPFFSHSIVSAHLLIAKHNDLQVDTQKIFDLDPFSFQLFHLGTPYMLGSIFLGNDSLTLKL
jgi:hypothetical protein